MTSTSEATLSAISSLLSESTSSSVGLSGSDSSSRFIQRGIRGERCGLTSGPERSGCVRGAPCFTGVIRQAHDPKRSKAEGLGGAREGESSRHALTSSARRFKSASACWRSVTHTSLKEP